MKRKGSFSLMIILIILIFIGVIFVFSSDYRIEQKLKVGNKYLENGKHEKAMVAYKSIIKKDKNNISARLGLSETYILEEDFDEAEEILREVLEIESTEAIAWENLIQLYNQLDKSKIEIARAVLDAYEATDEIKYKIWIEEHTPKAPKVNIINEDSSKSYIELDGINKNDKIFYSYNDEPINRRSESYSGAIPLLASNQKINLLVINEWDLSIHSNYHYTKKEENAIKDNKLNITGKGLNISKANINDYFNLTYEDLVVSLSGDQENGFYNGGRYVIFSDLDCTFFLETKDSTNEYPQKGDKVNGLGIYGESAIYGIKKDMSIDEVKDILGSPLKEGIFEPNGFGWYLYYEIDNNRFFLHTDSPQKPILAIEVIEGL